MYTTVKNVSGKFIANISFVFLFIIIQSCTVAEQVQRSATNKTSREIQKKANKKIEDVFNSKTKKETEEQTPKQPTTRTETEPTAGTNPQNNKNEKDPTENFEINNSDFTPGGIVIFEDNLEGEQIGEFPSKWDLNQGTVETMKMGSSNVVGFRTWAEVFPYLESDHYLPEKFTIEFDCYFHNYGNEGYTINFPGSTSCRINKNGIKYNSQPAAFVQVKQLQGWRHVDISFNKRALKIYFDGVRLANIPRLKEAPKKVTFSALVPGKLKGQFGMIKNIRIAEGAVPLYSKLISEGKFVTNDIHFDLNASTLKPESKKVIQQIAEMMKSHPEIQLSVEGHTDSDGGDTSNLTLSQKRAEAVKNALVYEGVQTNRLQTKGLGESMPISSNTTQEGKAKNRRVEFVLIR